MICLFVIQSHIPLSHLVFVLLRFCIVIQILSISLSSQVSITTTQQPLGPNTSDTVNEYLDNPFENKTNSNQKTKTEPHTLSFSNKYSNVTLHLGTTSHRVIDAKVTNKTITKPKKNKKYSLARKKSSEVLEPKTRAPNITTITSNAYKVEKRELNTKTNNTATSGIHRITKTKQNTISRPGVPPSSKNNTYMAFKNSRGSKRKKTISILGLFELTESNNEMRLEGLSELEAAKLAVEHVNKANMLYDYQMELHTNDTKSDPGVAVDAFFHAIYTRPNTSFSVLLGSASSDVTESLAKISPYWNIVQISFGAESPALSDRGEFPLFFRTLAPAASHIPATIAFLTYHNWKAVIALSQNLDLYSLAINDLVTHLEMSNITCRTIITFAETDFMDQLKMLKDHDVRIIIGSFSPTVAPRLFCHAHALGMTGPEYVWILAFSPRNFSPHNWWSKHSLEGCEVEKAVEQVVLVSSVGVAAPLHSKGQRSDASFLQSIPHPQSQYLHLTYDAVWVVAHAMRRLLGHNSTLVRDFSYNRKDIANLLMHSLSQVEFVGVSGPLSFDGADRIGISAFYQIQNGTTIPVARYNRMTQELNFSCPACGPLSWSDTEVPIAERILRLRIITIDPAAFLTITALAVVGIVLAFGFLLFNLHFRKLKYIKLSSPRLNNMAVIGCIFVYSAVILLALDHNTMPESLEYPTVCTARVYLLSAGFSLAFGSMFTKTYRVHRIFLRTASGIVKNKLLQDTQLICVICILLLIDGLIVTVWLSVDPMQRQLRNLTREISSTDRSVVYQPQVEVCGSQFTSSWLGALYAYKGLLLVVGGYMAWETRHVKLQALNDAQYIGLSVYLAVVTSALVVIVANLIVERVTLAFVLITVLILLSTTSSLCFLFIPKIHAILTHDDNPIMLTTGLKIEFNTRRFEVEDRKEIIYRVEVQNRVYRREILVLDNEIKKLEREIANERSDSNRSSGGDLPTIEEINEHIQKTLQQKQRGKSPSISGGLPMLLLSVLPPVIPRASWPSAEHCMNPMRRSVTFNSEPKLDESAVSRRNSRYDGEQSESEEKVNMLTRLRQLLGKNQKPGIASALRAHMGYITHFVPGKRSSEESVDSNDPAPINGGKNPQYQSGPIIITPDEDNIERTTSQHRVSFLLDNLNPDQESMLKQTRVCSPRFPHRILPTSSLTDIRRRSSRLLEEGYKSHSLEDTTRFRVWTTRESLDINHTGCTITADLEQETSA
uniref:Gamma-aminobutyric acid type B receptor subunit 2 n=1 Tax=Cacopsylla melanoneura TaxID=428564 RepID=A0A8D8SES4_9HEMI